MLATLPPFDAFFQRAWWGIHPTKDFTFFSPTPKTHQRGSNFCAFPVGYPARYHLIALKEDPEQVNEDRSDAHADSCA